MALCCICERPVDHWLPHPQQAQRSQFMSLMDTVGSDLSIFSCPHCGCTDRDRHLWLYMMAAGLPAQLNGASILHLAPERPLEPLLTRCNPSSYVRGDLFPSRAGLMKLDAELLPFDDGTFDLIIANHLLEHVKHPQQALAEFTRCLKPGGLLIAQTPYAPYLKQTFELNVPALPEFAKLFYGQEDHVRLFGADVADHFQAAGLNGQLLPHDHVLHDLDPMEFGCNAREPFFAFSKPLETEAAAA